MTAKKKQPKDTTIKKLCFVVGPIGEEGSDIRTKADWLLRGIIKPTLEARGYEVKRADEMPAPGNIDTQVINTVIDAELVVADLSELNANAFYELGLRHMSPNRPVIHMMRKGERIPFDNSSFRTIVFEHDTYEGMEAAKVALEAQLDEIEKDGFKVETPVSRARAVNDITFEGNDFEKTLIEEIEDLRLEINLLKTGNMQGLNIEYSNSVFVDGRDFTGNKLAYAELLYSHFNTMNKLLTVVYPLVKKHVRPFHYGKDWLLFDVKNKRPIPSIRDSVIGDYGKPVKDSRSLESLGVKPGSILEIIKPN